MEKIHIENKQSIKNKYRYVMLLLICSMYILSSCEQKKTLPDEVPDILREVYKNMNDPERYATVATLKMEMTLSGKDATVEIITKTALQKEPFHVTIINQSQMQNA